MERLSASEMTSAKAAAANVSTPNATDAARVTFVRIAEHKAADCDTTSRDQDEFPGHSPPPQSRGMQR
jgi:hypothetical protein